MPANASWTEVAFSAVALAGLLVTLWNARDAYGDRAALRASGRNGARKIVADDNIRRERDRALKLGIFLALGVCFMASAPANRDRPVTRLGLALAAALIAAEVLLVKGSIQDRRARGRLIAKIDLELAAHGGIE
jgi:hypothetical protein